MRELKFRGKASEGNWVFGNLLQFNDGSCHIKADDYRCRYGCGEEVNPDTIGQFTGLKDKNGIKVYEGDICSHRHYATAVVEWNDSFACFCLIEYNEGGRWDINFSLQDIKCVLGNIYDNSELINP